MDEGPSTRYSTASSNLAAGGPEPTLSTEVDDPSHPLFHHRRIVTDFDYGEILGEGSYSTVLVGRDKRTGKQYAVKRLDKAHIVKNNKVKYVMIERDAISRMNHPGIVKLYWTFKDNRSLFFVLDLARGGELYTYIRRLAPFDIDTARFYAAELLLAIEHIHSRGVIHRDIKPENILLDDKLHIKVADFGSAKIIQDNADGESADGAAAAAAAARSFVGTAEYVSPELLRSDPVSRETDFWALGCVIYQMLSGKSPFKAATDYLIFQKIKNLEYTMPDEFTEESKDIVQKLLMSNPDERLGSEKTGGIEAIKNHPFFKGVQWDTIFTSNAPPLKERLEEEMRKHPVPSPHFNFGQADEDEEDEEELWANQSSAPSHPFTKTAPSDVEATAAPVKATTTPHLNINTTVPKIITTDSKTSYKNRNSTLHAEDTMKTNSQLSSVASSVHSDAPDRSPVQPPPTWIPHLYPNESVIKSGRVLRRRGFLSKKRNLILTNRPRLLYLDEGSGKDKLDGNLRCEIPWTSKLLPELKGKSTFCIHTPEKSYTFEDRKHAQDWVNTINSMLVDSFGIAT